MSTHRSVTNVLVEVWPNLQSNGWEEASRPKRTERVCGDGRVICDRQICHGYEWSDKITENHNLRVFAPTRLPSINLRVIALRNAGISPQGSVNVFLRDGKLLHLQIYDGEGKDLRI